MKRFVLCILLVFLTQTNFAQNNRLNTYNSIGWFAFLGTYKLNAKFGIHAEAQLRRVNFVSHPQQGLLRVGMNYSANERVLFRLGYAWAETAAYGEFPINGFGKSFSEHRTFQLAQLSHKEGILAISHRFMLEQRWIGRYSNVLLDKEDSYLFSNRLRYMLRLQVSLKKGVMGNKTPYLAAYNELFIGFGKNVNANIFDQNRSSILFGYAWNAQLRVELGYLNQTLQFGRLVQSKNVFQHNNGCILNVYVGLEHPKKEQKRDVK